MAEVTGHIVFLNIHDYSSDYDGKHWDGCLASLTTDAGDETLIYTQSMRLQAALTTHYQTKGRVTASLGAEAMFLKDKSNREAASLLSSTGATSGGPFLLKSIWTRK